MSRLRSPFHILVWVLLAALLPGCAVVSVSSISPKEYLAERRGDVLTTGRLHGRAGGAACGRHRRLP